MKYVRLGQEFMVVTVFQDNKEMKGSISTINPIIDEHGLIRVSGILHDHVIGIPDGSHVMVNLQERLTRHLVIPREAIVYRSGRNVVFTQVNGKAHWNYVDIIHENTHKYAVSGGITTGDTIIVSGNLHLAHNTPVTADNPIQK